MGQSLKVFPVSRVQLIHVLGGYTMFVTSVLRNQVARMLQRLETNSRWLEECAHLTEDWSADLTRVLAAERAMHVCVELTTDAANAVIDALVMRDPGGYADIIRVLMEEGVVEKDWFMEFEGALAFRQKVIHGYLDLSGSEVVDAVRQYATLFSTYISKLRTYLEIEP